MIDVIVQIDYLRGRLNELTSHGAAFSEILSLSEQLDKEIVKFHRETELYS